MKKIKLTDKDGNETILGDGTNKTILLYNGRQASNQTFTLPEKKTWEDIGKFREMIVVMNYSDFNTTTIYTIPFEALSLGKCLSENTRNTNLGIAGGYSSSLYTLTFIPAMNITKTTIKFGGGYGDVVQIYIKY